MAALDLVAYSYEAGKALLEKRALKTLKENGQFLTPPPVARYMAQQIGPIHDGGRLLEPAIGSGVLVCAVIEQLIAARQPLERRLNLWIDAYETDRELYNLARQVLTTASEEADREGITLHWQIYHDDFVLACLPETQPTLFASGAECQKPVRNTSFDYIISNPPYFKLNHDDRLVKAAAGKLTGHTNIYTLFMALSARLLVPKGKACFITPRSFCSGVYFSSFRKELLQDVTPLSVYLFRSRDEIFQNDSVLQENVIFTYEKSPQRNSLQYRAGSINILTSKDDQNLHTASLSRQVAFRHFLKQHDGQFRFRLPTGMLDEQILDAVDRWEGSLEFYGLQVSTGPVVAFRAQHLLRGIPPTHDTVPLLWMQNVKPHEVRWPLQDLDKPQTILTTAEALPTAAASPDHSLLIPTANYVLLRRFSAKEDLRRLVAAPFLAKNFPYAQIGLENHLNFIYRKKATFGAVNDLQEVEAIGLAAILNSALIDRYFRIANGNTQVNAAELRALPLPAWEVICRIGEQIQNSQVCSAAEADKIVFAALRANNLIEDDFPMIQETRISMGKIEQAQEILEALGLPSAQQNEMSALTLLTLAQLSEDSPWQDARGRSLRVHDILIEIKQRYGREYAENTRETIRRQVLHQFEQAGLVIRNPEDPDLATNSPRTHYLLPDSVLSALRAYDTADVGDTPSKLR